MVFFTKIFLAFFIILISPQLFSHATPSTQLDKINHSLEHQPNSQKLYIKRSHLFMDIGKLDAALADLQHADTLGSRKNTLWPYAIYYQLGGELSKAEALATQHLKAQPNFSLALQLRSKIYAEQGRFAKAVRDYQKIVDQQLEKGPAAYIILADLMLMENPTNTERALNLINQGITTLNNPPQLLRYAIALELESGKYLAAIKHVDLLGINLGDTPEWKRDKAKALESSGDIAGAIAFYQLASDQLQNNPKLMKRIKSRQSLKVELDKKLAKLKTPPYKHGSTSAKKHKSASLLDDVTRKISS